MPPKRRSARKTRTRAAKRKIEVAAPQAGRQTSGLAPEMQAVNTYLAVANVNASIQFLEKAFGFTRGVVLPGADGQPRYAEMRHGDSVVMLIPKGDGTTATGGTAALYTYVSDVDKALTKARAAGAGVSEAEDRPWGDRTALVTDPDGYRWVLATFKKLVPFS
jgi:uncharacterized glyoxalase superfamily protein PhnB